MTAISIDAISALHRESIIRWQKGVCLAQEGFLALVEKNHAFNFQLWNAEDRARRDDKGHAFVYHAKREIDGFNQQRNNCMEAMDQWLFEQLSPAAPSINCPVHSETPGMIIDRLSILALKIHHMRLQTERTDVDDTHQQSCQKKLYTLLSQQEQLHQCIEQLAAEIKDKKRTFRLYHQFKMYNDPTLNPELYKQG